MKQACIFIHSDPVLCIICGSSGSSACAPCDPEAQSHRLIPATSKENLLYFQSTRDWHKEQERVEDNEQGAKTTPT